MGKILLLLTLRAAKIFVAHGGENCNRREVITTEERCRAAAKELGLPFNTAVTDVEFPAGCYSTGLRVCFNRIIDPCETDRDRIMHYRRGLCEKGIQLVLFYALVLKIIHQKEYANKITCVTIHFGVLDCSPPDAPDVSYGKYCGDGGCINSNTGYSTLLEAWNNCGQVLGCGFIMLYSDNKYYLRRNSDPSQHGYKGYLYPENCGIYGFKYCRTTNILPLFVFTIILRFCSTFSISNYLSR